VSCLWVVVPCVAALHLMGLEVGGKTVSHFPWFISGSVGMAEVTGRAFAVGWGRSAVGRCLSSFSLRGRFRIIFGVRCSGDCWLAGW